MLTKIHWLTFVFIAICFIINPQSLTASTNAEVKYDGKQLSVHASGVSLDQLLTMVEKHTGIQFSYDDLAAETNVYANFDNNSLDEGVRRILLQFNYAVIYNGSGHIKNVLVLNRQMASSKNPADQTELYALQQETDINDTSEIFSEQPVQAEAPSDTISFPDPEQSSPSSEQLSEKETSEHDLSPEKDMPPGAEYGTPPGGEAQSLVVDPNLSPPPGALVEEDSNSSSPPGAETSATEEQAAPQAS